MLLPAGGGKGQWDSQTSGRQLPLPLLSPPPPAGPSRCRHRLLQADPAGRLLIQLRKPEGICKSGQTEDRRALSPGLYRLTFSPTKKVMKGQEGRPPKHCVRLDGQMLLERWRRLKGNPPEFSEPAGRCPSCWEVGVAGMGGGVARKKTPRLQSRLQHNSGKHSSLESRETRVTIAVPWGLQRTPGAGTAPSIPF